MVGGAWAVPPSAGAKPPVGAAIDSRDIKAGMLFAAFRGERVDGHRYLEQAQASGAAMALATDADSIPDGIVMPVLAVGDATVALERMASHWRDAIDGLRVVGVTGSNGKTTTCRLLHAAACLGEDGALEGTRTSKSFNNALGVPLTVLNARPGDAVLICEIGMSTPGEIAARCRTARPDAAIITTVSEAHLEGVGSLEGIAREKASIAADLPYGAPLFMPAGLDVLEGAVAALERKPGTVRVGVDARAGVDHVVSDVWCEAGRTRFRLDDVEFEVGLAGAHNAMNAALAVVAARWLGVSDDAIARGLLRAEAPKMRLERVVIDCQPPIVVINDAYNANPSSMRAALEVLASTEASGRRVAVLGDMLELGEGTRRAHGAMLEAARGAGIDAVLTIGPRFDEAGGGGERAIDDDAIERVAERLAPGDVVLLKGSRGMRLERVLDALGKRFQNDVLSDGSAVDA